ncbi:hypothetical protein, partial [Rhizobium leguminosarum]|uniref:hypothetical protein n=1 Tax=Rhizobium leguminosarum TaxID=384 RepID=UPI003F9A3227
LPTLDQAGLPDDAANHGYNEQECCVEDRAMKHRLKPVARGERLLGRYGTILVHVSIRNTQICHMSPPFFLGGMTMG